MTGIWGAFGGNTGDTQSEWTLERDTSRLACWSGKVGYQTRKKAAYFAAKLNITKPRPENPAQAYKCKHCRKWHVGHPRVREQP